VARRLGRRPRSVEQIHWLARERVNGNLPPASARQGRNLTPVERCVLRRLEAGENYGDIGNRIMRSGAQVRRIETWARFKLDGTWATPDPAG
jgi:DNA-binding CsgD family transcriptional regulator